MSGGALGRPDDALKAATCIGELAAKQPGDSGPFGPLR
jgi:hypothetical protein